MTTWQDGANEAARSAQTLIMNEAQPGRPYKIGDRVFTVQPLKWDALFTFGEVLMSEIANLKKDGIITAETVSLLENVNLDSLDSLLATLLKVWRRLPTVGAQLFGLMLSVPAGDGESLAFISAHITLPQVIKMLRDFLDVNEWRDLVHIFTALRSEIGGAIRGARAEENITTS